MLVRFKKINERAVEPKRATIGSAGFDMTASSCEWDERTACWDYGTGIAVEIPEGHVGLVFPRSSVYRTGAVLSNCVGVIDSDYRGEIRAKFYSVSGRRDCPYMVGDRIMQLVIAPLPDVELVEADELDMTERGTGGFGSTGR